MTGLREALVDEIRDIYHAEKQLTKALPKMTKVATNQLLCDAFDAHLDETQTHVERLERVFELLDEPARGKPCPGMAGIIEEASEKLQGDLENAVLDACLIGAAQKAEHYEIGAYGTAIAWAQALDLKEVADVLSETLAEEKAADEKLSSLAKSGINSAASAEEPEEEETARAPKRTEPAGAAARSARTRGGRR